MSNEEKNTNIEVDKRSNNKKAGMGVTFSYLLFFFILMLDYADQNLLNPLVNPLLEDFFGTTERTFPLSVVTSVFTIFSAISMILAGYYADKGQRKKICISGGLVYSFFSIITFFTPHGQMGYTFYFITRALNGIGIGVIVPTIFSLVGDMVEKERRTTVFSYIVTAMLIGQMLGLGLGSSIEDSWRIAYFSLGLLNLIFIFLLFFIKEPKRGAQEEELKEVIVEGAEYRFKIRKEDLKYIWSNKSNFWLIINFIDTFPSSIIIFLIFKYMEDIHGLPGDVATIMILLVGIFGAVGTLLFGKLGDVIFKKTRKGKIIIALFCNFFPVVFFIVFLNLNFKIPADTPMEEILANPNVITLISMIVITMFINQGVGPNWYSSLTDINLPEHRGTMISVASFMDMVGNAIGPLIGSVIADNFGLQAGMWSAVVFWLLNGLLWLPIFYYIERDLDSVHGLLLERKNELLKEIDKI